HYFAAPADDARGQAPPGHRDSARHRSVAKVHSGESTSRALRLHRDRRVGDADLRPASLDAIPRPRDRGRPGPALGHEPGSTIDRHEGNSNRDDATIRDGGRGLDELVHYASCKRVQPAPQGRQAALAHEYYNEALNATARFPVQKG